MEGFQRRYLPQRRESVRINMSSSKYLLASRVASITRLIGNPHACQDGRNMARTHLPSTKHRQALLYCGVCDVMQRHLLPDVYKKDDMETSAWRMTDLWPRCCGSDLRLMELLPQP